LRCFFFAIRLRRFLMTEPTNYTFTGWALLLTRTGTPTLPGAAKQISGALIRFGLQPTS
jgi:hypothetical protein